MARLLALLLLPLALAAPAQAQLGQLVVNLTDPDAGQTVSGTVNVRASVTIIGLLTVSRVDFYVDGSFIGSDGSAPYAVSWDSRGVGNGPRSLRDRAQDVVGVRVRDGSGGQDHSGKDQDVRSAAHSYLSRFFFHLFKKPPDAKSTIASSCSRRVCSTARVYRSRLTPDRSRATSLCSSP
jgi:hypothetical protein